MRSHNDPGCDQDANEWTIAVSHFSEYVFGEATCAVVKKRKLILAGLGKPYGDETLRFEGQINVDVPVDPAIDPIANGISLVIETAKGRQLYATSVAKGSFDAGTEAGWTKAANKPVWRYDRAAEKGVVQAKVSTVGAAARRVKFDVTAQRLRLGKVKDGDLPLTARFILDGRCGDAAYAGPAPAPRCAFSADRTELDCR